MLSAGRRIVFTRALLPAALLGVLNPGISYTFSMLALDRIPASVASIFWATEPFLILLLAAIVLKEGITLATTAIIAIGFAGAVLVAGVLSPAAERFVDPVGAGFMAIANLLCAIYTVLSRRVVFAVDPLSLVAIQQLAGLAWAALLFAATSNALAPIGSGGMSGREILHAALSGVMYYAVAYWLYLVALNRVSAAVAGASFNIIPVVAIGMSYLFLGERLNHGQIAGMLLILCSGSMLVWLTIRTSPVATAAGRGEPM